MTSRWFPFRFQANHHLPTVYLTPDSSTPRSLVVIPEFDFPLPSPESPCPTPNDHIPGLPSTALTSDPFHPADMSPRRPNKLRKPPPSRLRAAVTPMLPALLHVLSSPLAGGGGATHGETDAVIQQPHVRSDAQVTTIYDGLPPSPTPSNATVSASSQVPLMAASRVSSSFPNAPRPISTPARKLTKRKRKASPSYFKLTDDHPNTSASGSAQQSTCLPIASASNDTNDSGTRPGPSPTFQNLPPGAISDSDWPSDSWSGRPRRQRGDSVPDPVAHYQKVTQIPNESRGGGLRGRSHSEIRYRDAEKELLPPVRPASPFCVNMPIHHEWRERRANFHVGTPPLTTSEPLASFAWTGIAPLPPLPSSLERDQSMRAAWSSWELLSAAGDPVSESKSSESLSDAIRSEPLLPITSLSEPQRSPTLVKREAETSNRQRWTLAMAVTDDQITDEVLVEGLEQLRRHSVSAPLYGNPTTDRQNQTNDDNADAYHGTGYTRCRSAWRYVASPTPSLPFPSSPTVATWGTARRALFTCRELVRTERRYLADLRVLLGGDNESTSSTAQTRSPLILEYVPALVHVSDGILERMTEDPSAWGVSAAFVGAEPELENAFVKWSAIVGEFFVGDDNGKGAQRGRKSLRRRSVGDAEDVAKRKSIGTSVTDAILPARSLSGWRRKSATEKEAEECKRNLPVRDLAILPTQRVTRYVLLYRELLEHTPMSSPSRALVECAVDAALRIARKCDEAQSNAGFRRS